MLRTRSRKFWKLGVWSRNLENRSRELESELDILPPTPQPCEAVQTSFRRKFQCRQAPSNSRIFDWIQKLQEHGTVHNLNSKCLRDTYSGRTVSARTQSKIDTVRDSVGRSPKKSLRLRSQLLAYFGKNMTFMRRDFNE